MTSSSRSDLLTIGDLAARTGVPPATLRSWESRYGFPRPVRRGGGHRRYAESEAAAVQEVLRHRDGGLALAAAVRRVAAGSFRSKSVHAELRRRHPELVPQLLSKRSLLALSRAIEDECCARAERPLLFAGFQRQAFLHASYARWTELARTARAAVVFASLDAPTAPRPGLPIEVALPPEAPLNREWIIVCDAPDLPACMAAVERPGQEEVPDRHRRFETVWSVDPRVVRDASRMAAALADGYQPAWRSPAAAVPNEEPPAASADLRRATDLLNRMMGYLEAGH